MGFPLRAKAEMTAHGGETHWLWVKPPGAVVSKEGYADNPQVNSASYFQLLKQNSSYLLNDPS